MTIYQFKITAVLKEGHKMIINLFTSHDMNDVLERECYMMELLDSGLVVEDILFEKINTCDSSTPYHTAACAGILYAAEYPN